MCVPVSHMSHQLTARGEAGLAVLALMRLGPCVRINVVQEAGLGLEASLTHGALVRPVIRVRLHVSAQQIPLRRAVVTIVTREGGSHLTCLLVLGLRCGAQYIQLS